MWEEIQNIAAMKFRFIEEEDSCDIVTRLASSMGWVRPEHLLVAEYMHEKWQPEKVSLAQGLVAAWLADGAATDPEANRLPTQRLAAGGCTSAPAMLVVDFRAVLPGVIVQVLTVVSAATCVGHGIAILYGPSEQQLPRRPAHQVICRPQATIGAAAAATVNTSSSS